MADPTRRDIEYLRYLAEEEGEAAAQAEAERMGVVYGEPEPLPPEPEPEPVEEVEQPPVESVLYDEAEPEPESPILGTPGVETWFPPPPISTLPSTTPYDVEKAMGEAIQTSKVSYIARGYSPDMAEAMAARDARAQAYLPRDVSGRRVSIATTARPEDVTGFPAVIEAMKPQVLQTAEQKAQQADFEQQAETLRERLLQEVYAEMPSGLTEEEKAGERVSRLREKLEPWKTGFQEMAVEDYRLRTGKPPAGEKEIAQVEASADRSYRDFVSRVAPELYEEEYQEAKKSRYDLLKEAAGTAASRVLGPLMVSEDEETGAVSESLLATGLRDLSVLWGSVLDPAGEALTYEVDKEGNVLDPEDYAYRIERVVENAKQKAGMGELEPAMPLWTAAATPMALLPRPFQAVEVTPETKSTGEYFTNLARYVEQGRFTGEGFMALPEYQGKWEERGYPNAPYWLGLGVEVALPFSPLSAVPTKVIGRGLRRVAARTAAEAAQEGLETTVDLGRMAGEHTVIKEVSRHVASEVVQPEVVLAYARGKTTPHVDVTNEVGSLAQSSVVRDIIIKNTDEAGNVSRAGLVADLEKHQAKMQGLRDAGKLSPEVKQAYDVTRTLTNRFARLTDAEKQARVEAALALQSAGDEAGASKIIQALNENVHGRTAGIPVPRDILTAQYLRAMASRMGGKPDVKLPVDEFIDRYKFAFNDVELFGDSVAETVEGGVRNALRDRVPGDMVMVTPAVMVNTDIWARHGGRVVREVRDTMGGGWKGGRYAPTTPDRVRDALLDALGPGRGEGGYWRRVVDDLESGKGLAPDQYLATYNEVLGDAVIRNVSDETPTFAGKAVQEASVPVQRRMELGRLAREAYRALPTGVRKAIEENRLVKRLSPVEQGKTPLAVKNWLDELTGKAARLNDDFISDLKKLQEEMGVEDGYQAMIDSTGVSDETWGVLVRRYFGPDIAIEDELVELVTKGRRVTPRDLSEVIAELRALDKRLTKKGLRSPVPGMDAPHLFATLTTWMIAVRQNKLVEQSFGEFLTKHPELGLPLQQVIDASASSNMKDTLKFLLDQYLPPPSTGKTVTRTTTRDVPYDIETPQAGVTPDDWEQYVKDARAGVASAVPDKYPHLTFPPVERAPEPVPAGAAATGTYDWDGIVKEAEESVQAAKEELASWERNLASLTAEVKSKGRGSIDPAKERAIIDIRENKIPYAQETIARYEQELADRVARDESKLYPTEKSKFKVDGAQPDEAVTRFAENLAHKEAALKKIEDAPPPKAPAQNSKAFLDKQREINDRLAKEGKAVSYPEIIDLVIWELTGGKKAKAVRAAEGEVESARRMLESARDTSAQRAAKRTRREAEDVVDDLPAPPPTPEMQALQARIDANDAEYAVLKNQFEAAHAKEISDLDLYAGKGFTHRFSVLWKKFYKEFPDIKRLMNKGGILQHEMRELRRLARESRIDEMMRGKAAPLPDIPLPPELMSPPPVKSTGVRPETTTTSTVIPPIDLPAGKLDRLAESLSAIAARVDAVPRGRTAKTKGRVSISMPSRALRVKAAQRGLAARLVKVLPGLPQQVAEGIATRLLNELPGLPPGARNEAVRKVLVEETGVGVVPYDADSLAERLSEIATGLDKADKIAVAKKILATKVAGNDVWSDLIDREQITRILVEAGIPEGDTAGIVQDVVDTLRLTYAPIDDYLEGQLRTWGILHGGRIEEVVAHLRPEIISPKTAEGASLLGGDFKAAYDAIKDGAQSGDLARALEDLRVKDPNIASQAVRMADVFVRFLRRGTTGGLLGGFPINPRYHGVNFFTAPFIIATTLGVPDALKAVNQGLSRLSPWKYMKAGKSPDALVFRDRSGREWTRGMVDEAIARNNIAYGQQAFEFRDGIITDMMRQAQLNPDITRMGKAKEGWGWLSPFGKNVGAQLGEMNDNFWRENVFVTALKEGVPEAQAAQIARESLLDYSQVPAWVRDYAGRWTLIFAFRYRMMAETLEMLVRDPNVARRMILASRAQQEKQGLWENQGDDTLTRLYGEMGEKWDEQATGLYGPANPPVESLADLVHFLGWAAGGGDIAQAKEALVEEISIPELAMLRDVLDVRKDEEGYRGVPSTRVMQLIGTPLWQSFVDWFDVEPKPYDERKAGEPTFTGQQYRFATKTGYNNYLRLEYLLMRAGVKRQVDELARVGIARGELEGVEGVEPKRYGEPSTLGYALGLQTPLKTTSEMVARERALRRALGELKAMAKE